MLVPDYQGGSIVNLMSSFARGMGGTHDYPALLGLSPEEVRQYRNVVLLVVDGLGDAWLQRQSDAWWMSRHRRDRMTTVFPTTTASAITTYLTGCAPQQHAITGWHVWLRELAAVTAVLPGTPRAGGADYAKTRVDVKRLFGHTAFADGLERASWMLSPESIVNSPYNRAHQGQATMRSFRKMRDLFSQLVKMVKGDRRQFIYAYWSELDHIGHEKGMNSPAAIQHARQIDEEIARCMDRVRGSDTLLIVTADHGQVDTRDDSEICVNDHPEWQDMLLLPLCGERRASYAYVRHERRADFERYVTEHFADALALMPSADVIEQGWFGHGDAHPELRNRVGDYLLLAKEHHYVKDWLPQERRYGHIGLHGSLTEEELYVPLIVGESA